MVHVTAQPPSPSALRRDDAQRANPATVREPARLARDTTPDNPWPLYKGKSQLNCETYTSSRNENRS